MLILANHFSCPEIILTSGYNSDVNILPSVSQGKSLSTAVVMLGLIPV